MPTHTVQKRPPDISFLVTANAKPNGLRITLLSLKMQIGVKCEILVSNNSKTHKDEIQEICTELKVRSIVNTKPECYSASNLLAEQAKGRYVCFPSEEDYYIPIFGRQLLTHARRFKLHLAYCDCVYDSRYIGSYEIMRVQPIIGHIDKGGFILKRSMFNGFPHVPTEPIPAFCDGYLIEQLRGKGISFGKIHEVLWVHN